MTPEDTWRVEVVFATPSRQEVIEMPVRPGTTVEQAIRESGILEQFPEIDLARHRVGIFSELAGLQDPVRDGDRIEIYRPLQADPKEARKRRVARRMESAGSNKKR